MRIFKEKIIFRLKNSEYGQFEAIRKRETMSMADAGRLLFHLGIIAYQQAHRLDLEKEALENQERAGRQPSTDEDLNPYAALQEVH